VLVRPGLTLSMTEQQTSPHTLQMMHSYYTTYDRAEIPPAGKSPDDLNGHIASHLAAGWAMAFYSAVATATGSVHHFWRGPEPPLIT
jgi:hypothetical protein